MPETCITQNDVGMFRVDAHQLKIALLPSPTALLAQLGQCLPRAAAQLYAVFVDQVHSATSILKASISSVEDYVHQLAFLETLKVRTLRTCVSQLSAAIVRHDDFITSCRTMLVLLARGFLQCTLCFETLAMFFDVTEHQEQLDDDADQQPNSPDNVLRCQLVTLLVVAGKPEQGG